MGRQVHWRMAKGTVNTPLFPGSNFPVCNKHLGIPPPFNLVIPHRNISPWKELQGKVECSKAVITVPFIIMKNWAPSRYPTIKMDYKSCDWQVCGLCQYVDMFMRTAGMENAEHWVFHTRVINLGKHADLYVAARRRGRQAGEGAVPPDLES